VEAFIEVGEEIAKALGRFDGFSQLVIVSFLHKAGQRPLGTRPVRIFKDVLERLGVRDEQQPEVGVFSVACPLRPNPIAISVVHLLKRDGGVLYVAGATASRGPPCWT